MSRVLGRGVILFFCNLRFLLSHLSGRFGTVGCIKSDFVDIVKTFCKLFGFCVAWQFLLAAQWKSKSLLGASCWGELRLLGVCLGCFCEATPRLKFEVSF